MLPVSPLLGFHSSFSYSLLPVRTTFFSLAVLMSTLTVLAAPTEALHVGPTPSLLPFHLAHSGPAPISTYFITRLAPSDPHALTQEDLLLSTFRGRGIVGQTLVIPAGYQGIVLEVPPPPPKRAASSSTEFEDSYEDMEGIQDAPSQLPVAAVVASGVRRSPRKRTQASTSTLPPPKKARVAARKFALDDSDSEDDGEETKGGAGTPALSLTGTTSLSTAPSTADLATPTDEVPSFELNGETLVVEDEEGAMEGQEEQSPEVKEPVVSAIETVEVVVVAPAQVDPPLASTVVDAPSEVGPTTISQAHNASQLLDSSSDPPARLLKPLSTFETITLWTADDPVDKHRDEYFRCLGVGGWLDMSAVIHQEEEDED